MSEPEITQMYRATLCLNNNITSYVRFKGTNIDFDGTDAGSADVKVESFDSNGDVINTWKKYGSDDHLSYNATSQVYEAKVRLDGTVGTQQTNIIVIGVDNPDGGSDTDTRNVGYHFERNCDE